MTDAPFDQFKKIHEDKDFFGLLSDGIVGQDYIVGFTVAGLRQHAHSQLVSLFERDDYNSEIRERLDGLSNALITVSKNDVATTGELFKDVGALAATCMIDGMETDSPYSVIGVLFSTAMFLFQINRLANAALHHDSGQMAVWAAAHPDFVPGPCDCQLAAMRTSEGGEGEEGREGRETSSDHTPESGEPVVYPEGERSEVVSIVGWTRLNDEVEGWQIIDSRDKQLIIVWHEHTTIWRAISEIET